METTIKTTSQLFKNYKIEEKKTRRTERGDLLDMFLDQLNRNRREDKLKEFTRPFISFKFSQARMTVSQMYQFYKDCERAEHFSKYFWWALNPNKHR